MALITSAATGNFNAGATWTGGVVPGVGDEARASNGHTITITADVTCDEVSNAGTGIFTLADGVTLTANVTSKSTTTARNCLQLTGSASGAIVGNLQGGTVTDARAVLSNSSGTLTVTATTINGGTGAGSFGIFTQGASGSTVIVCTSATGGSTAQNTAAIRLDSTGTHSFTGNAFGGTANGCHGYQLSGATTATITGNVTGGSAATAYGANNVALGTLNIVGIAEGGADGAGVNNTSTGTVNVTRAKANTYGPGNTSGQTATEGARNAGVGIIELQEIEYGEYGMSPTSGTGIRLKKLGSNVAVFNYVDAGAAKTLVDATQGQMPAEADVRDGVSYASGALTGTCKVPAAASVAFGVPVDATTGTAALEPSDIAAAVWDRVLTGATHNIPSSAGRRLRILDDERIIADGQVVSATTNTITLQPIGSLCVGQTIVVTSDDTGEKQTRFILAYDSATNTASVDTQWCNIPEAGDEYLLTTVRDPLVTRNDHPAGTVGAEIDEQYLLQGLKVGETLTVTPTSRTAGAIAQTIGGDGTNTTTVSRD
jgi:hypothetical protein